MQLRDSFIEPSCRADRDLSNLAPDTAAAGAWALVEQLGLTAETIDEITTLPAERIEAAAAAVVAAGGTASWTGPVNDGRNFTREPFDPDAAPQSASVPLLIGTTRTEMSLLAGAAVRSCLISPGKLYRPRSRY